MATAVVDTFSVLAGIAFILAAPPTGSPSATASVALVLPSSRMEKRAPCATRWLWIDLKLGAWDGTKLLLMLITSTVLSIGLWLIGLPYFLPSASSRAWWRSSR